MSKFRSARCQFYLPLAVGLAVRIGASWVSHGRPLVDVSSFLRWAQDYDAGLDPYTTDSPANYPPLWIYVCWICLKLSTWSTLSFDLVLKLLISVCDSVTVIAVGRVAHALGASDVQTRLASWLYALNPVPVLIASFHAQNDPVVIGLLMWAGWLMVARPIRHATSWGLAVVGISLGIKPIAVLYLPILLMYTAGWRERLGGICVAFGLGLACWVPHLVHGPAEVVEALGSYRGPPDLGYVGIMNSWWNLGLGGEGVPIIEALPRPARFAALGVCLLIWWTVRQRNLVEQLLMFTLSLYLLYGTLGAQYLVWFVPMAAALRSPQLWKTSLLTAATLVAFYQLNHPGILSGIPHQRVPMGITIPQWSGLLLFTQVLLYVEWLRWFCSRWAAPRSGEGECSQLTSPH